MKISRRREWRDRELLHGPALALARDRRRHDDHRQELEDEPDDAGHHEVLALQIGVEAELGLHVDRRHLLQPRLQVAHMPGALEQPGRHEDVLLHGRPAQLCEQGRRHERVGAVDHHPDRHAVTGVQSRAHPRGQHHERVDAIVEKIVLGLRHVRLGGMLPDVGLERDAVGHRLHVLVGDAAPVHVENPCADAGHARIADGVAEDDGEDRRHEEEKGERPAIADEVQELLQRQVIDVPDHGAGGPRRMYVMKRSSSVGASG